MLFFLVEIRNLWCGCYLFTKMIIRYTELEERIKSYSTSYHLTSFKKLPSFLKRKGEGLDRLELNSSMSGPFGTI